MTNLSVEELKDCLKEYIEIKIESLKSLYTSLRDTDRIALVVAKAEVDRRLAEMNEFRAQLAAERKDFISRIEYESKHASLRTEVDVKYTNHGNVDNTFHKETEERIRKIEGWQAKVTGALILISVLGVGNFIYLMLHPWPILGK